MEWGRPPRRDAGQLVPFPCQRGDGGSVAALTHATSAFRRSFSKDSQINALLQGAITAHDAWLREYDNWDYRGVLFSAEESLSLISKSLALMGQAGLLHYPLEIKPLAAEMSFRPTVDSLQIEQAMKSLAMERCQQGVRFLDAH